jgi:hypothetical protein
MRTFHTIASNQNGTILHTTSNHSAPISFKNYQELVSVRSLFWQVETGKPLAIPWGVSRRWRSDK